MNKADDYKQLMESLTRIFDVLPDMEDDEKEDEKDGGKDDKKKTASITIVTMGKGSKIPKATGKKPKVEDEDE